MRQAWDAGCSIGSEIGKSPEGTPGPLERAKQARALSNGTVPHWLHNPDNLGNSLLTLHLPRGLARRFQGPSHGHQAPPSHNPQVCDPGYRGSLLRGL